MKLNLTDTLYALSFALDTVQYEMGGISNHHGKNVAYVSYFMGKYLNYDNDMLNDLVGLAILHDNAFTEYVREEYNNGELLNYDELVKTEVDKLRNGFLTLPRHNVVGEENIRLIPFRTNVKNVILYHHENADGSGPLKKKDYEVPEMAQIIHIADMMDVLFDLKNINESEFKLAIEKIKKLEGKLFSKKMVDTLVNSFTYNEIKILQTEGVIPYLKRNLKSDIRDYDEKEIKNLCLFFAKIIDYKSSTTKNHSLGVADKCMKMAKFYGFSDDKALRFYFAGAFHDIGKLIINNDILEKPGKLTTAEFENIKNHAKATERILSQIEGIEDIARWAGRHHEKLDGSGYNQSLSAKDLSFEDRLLACIDIYQALTEKRSYKDKFIHDDSINIMMDMANDNKIDINIVKDITKCFGKEEEK
ncbi:MAG: HD domain-containing protein [Acholeplasmatales bacterium]|nr:HD domain-containing protein [Acholeplasmatales bacterium]